MPVFLDRRDTKRPAALYVPVGPGCVFQAYVTIGTRARAYLVHPHRAARKQDTSGYSGSFMRETETRDRVRVFRVRIPAVDGVREIPSCWISVHSSQRTVRIWLAPNAPRPDYTLSLEDVVIDWLAPVEEA